MSNDDVAPSEEPGDFDDNDVEPFVALDAALNIEIRKERNRQEARDVVRRERAESGFTEPRAMIRTCGWLSAG